MTSYVNFTEITIHKTHSKKRLIDLFNILGYKISFDLSKLEVINEINEVLKTTNLIYSKCNNYNIANETDLLNYLTSPNIIEVIKPYEKDKVMLICKRIINYGRTLYNINLTDYNDDYEIYEDILYISQYGWIPSVRRACSIYNLDFNKVNHVNPVIPQDTIDSLKRKRIYKESQIIKFTINIGHYDLDNM
tara:strand:- start:2185 stop:2757 length:573 start_codon:yes stop_codon:yes gene_type:complete